MSKPREYTVEVTARNWADAAAAVAPPGNTPKHRTIVIGAPRAHATRSRRAVFSRRGPPTTSDAPSKLHDVDLGQPPPPNGRRAAIFTFDAEDARAQAPMQKAPASSPKEQRIKWVRSRMPSRKGTVAATEASTGACRCASTE